MGLKSSNKVDTNRYELNITIDGETFSAANDRAFRKNAKKLNIPGFRKGKAPRGIIEKMYGENVFYEEAFNELYSDAIDSAAQEADVEIVDNRDLEFELKSMDKKDGVEFTVKVTVKPEAEIGEYKGLTAEKPSAEPTEEEVAAEIEQLRQRNSRMVEVTDRAIENGDIAVIDFEGFADGVAFEGGKGESHSLTIGSGQFIPGFEEQLIGHKSEEELTVKVTFPEEYHAEDLKGKEAEFKVKIHEVKMRELPEADDEFAKDVSEFDSLAALKEDLLKKVADKKANESEKAVDTQLIEALLKEFKAEIPEAMIETKIDEGIRDFDYNLQMQGLNLQQYLQYMGGDIAGMRDGFKEQAEKQVKIRLALEKVVKLENIVPTEEEIAAEYARFAEFYKMEIEKIKQVVPEKEICKDLAVQKATDLIKENAVITDEKPAAKKATKKPAAKKASAKAEKTEDAE